MLASESFLRSTIHIVTLCITHARIAAGAVPDHHVTRGKFTKTNGRNICGCDIPSRVMSLGVGISMSSGLSDFMKDTVEKLREIPEFFPL